jgi:Nickel responsive protein SCO4226-like
VAEYLLETYVSRNGGEAVPACAERARRAAEQLTWQGTSVRFLRTVFVPEDETCFYLYEAASEEAVREAADRAQLRIERIVEAITPLGEEAPM